MLYLVVVRCLMPQAGQQAAPAGQDPPLVQHEPGQQPGHLQQEDAAQPDAGVDAEGLETCSGTVTRDTWCGDT